jgi:hypothetical protein
MNAYYTNTNIRRNIRSYERNDSDAIRKAYLANTRKKEFSALIGALAASIDSKALRNLILSLKVISGILCAIGFISVICLIEAGSLSVVSGIIATAIIAAVECLCFVPTVDRQKASK